MTEVDHEVLVVGYGPVGQSLAILLAQRGHSVGVVERWTESYARPRAVHFDDEIARVFADLGIGDQLATFSEPSGEYDWQNADGETLLHFDWAANGASGWPTGNMFAQPALEKVLAARAESLPGVGVRRGQQAVELVDHGDHVEVGLRDQSGAQSRLRAAYVVGCDGANSFVRQQMDTTVSDLGFFYDWLIVDLIPDDKRKWKPFNLQMCDPARPTTVVSGGPGRRRWEFMRLPHESVAELNTAQTAWRLLAPWDYTPDNAVLERHTVYTFQARWVDRWRTGRVLLAGDAAHLMPPFAGQGMCSGIRDAANLAWKLDLVLSKRSSATLLDTYTSERSAHVQHAIGMSVELGNVICLTDPEQVAARDAAMLGAGGRPEVALPPIPPPVLGPGVLHVDADGALLGPAGQLSAQGRITDRAGRSGRLDEIVGTGFVLISAADLAGELAPEVLDIAHRIGLRLMLIVEPDTPLPDNGPAEIAVDVDNFYLPYLRALGCEAVISRPDFYYFGAATTAADVASLITELGRQLWLQT